jgi:hypothetical protein
MMAPARVNLLKKSEQRYQGAVSRRFMLASVVITPIMVIAVLSAIKLIQYTGVQAQLEASREIWADLKPKLDLYKDENRGLVANRKMLGLIDGWQGSQGSFVQLLEDVQQTVPENIQFTRLAVRGSSKASEFATPEEMALGYTLTVEGISQGDQAEKQVIDLRRDLLACERIGATFSSLKLASLRKRSSNDDVNARDFRLVGSDADGGGQ